MHMKNAPMSLTIRYSKQSIASGHRPIGPWMINTSTNINPKGYVDQYE